MRIIGLTTCLLLLVTIAVPGGEEWLQLKYDCRHSGNVPDRTVTTPLGLVGAVALTDAVFTSPVVAGQRVYVLDGSGVLFAIDRETLQVIWKFASRGGPGNCNNVSSPAIAGDYVHFGTTAGSYYVLNRTDGALVKEIICGEPVFSAPVVSQGRVYFATLGSQVSAGRGTSSRR
jgi:outer membrane protein assembly factor BamB